MKNNMVVLIGIVIMSVMSYCHAVNSAKKNPIFSKMIVSKDTVYGLTQENTLYRWTGSAWDFVKSSGSNAHIAMSPDGTFYLIRNETSDCGGPDDGEDFCMEAELGWVVYRLNTNKRWERVAILGGGSDIKEFAVLDNNDFLILKDNGEIVRKTGDVWRTLN